MGGGWWVGRIWEDLGGGKHDQNILHEKFLIKKLAVKLEKTLNISEWLKLPTTLSSEAEILNVKLYFFLLYFFYAQVYENIYFFISEVIVGT